MRVSTPISNISYNTDEFLTYTLNGLLAECKIEFWAYINHLPDIDNGKAHKHLFMLPSGLVNTSLLTDRFKEPDLKNPDKPPLSVIFWRRSKFVDWYLYALHDEDYLYKIGQEPRKYHYQKSDIIVSSEDYFNGLIYESDVSKYKNASNIRDIANSGVSFRDLVINGHIPIQQINQWEKFYNLVRGNGDEMPLGGGGGSSEGVPFTGTQREPARGNVEYKQTNLLDKDFEEFVSDDGEIVTMHKVYSDDMPFK